MAKKMTEAEAMAYIKELVEEDQFIPLLFSEASQFVDGGEIDDISMEDENPLMRIPNFSKVVEKMNLLMKMDNIDEMAELLTNCLSTVWAYEILMSNTTNKAYKQSLEDMMNRKAIKTGADKKEIDQMLKEVRKLTMLFGHLKLWLGKHVRAEVEAHNQIMEELEKAQGKSSSKEENKGYG